MPFATQDAADAFAAQEGGTVMRLSDIPDDLVLTPEETGPTDTADDADFEDRLRALSRPAEG